MDAIREAIRDIIREEIAGLQLSTTGDPELIKIADAAKLCDVDRSVIDALVKESPANGFPAVRVGGKTVRIDKRRLNGWVERGGLTCQH